MIKTVTMNPAVDKTVEIDDFSLGTLNRISSVRLDAGGKGINVSKTIKALGGKSLATGILAGRNGDYIKNCLDQMDIANDFLFVKGETRTNIKVVDRVNNQNTDINEPGLDVSQEDLRLVENKVFQGIDMISILVLSGSVPSNTPKGLYKEWIERAQKSDTKVLLDSDGELLREGIKARPFLVKPNIDELERLLGRKLGSVAVVAEAARSITGSGVEIVAVSLGSEGAVFVDRHKAIHAEGLSVDVKSTVGAGDAMVAALALSFSRGFDIEKAVALSVAASAAKVATHGTQAPELEDILNLETQVKFNYI